MNLPSKVPVPSIWGKIENQLSCRILSVPAAAGSKTKHKLYLTKTGWLLGEHEHLRDVLKNVTMEGLWKSELATVWQKSNKDHKGNERRMRFGRRAGDIMEPGAKAFASSAGSVADRTASLASRVHTQDHYQYADKNTIPRELEKDKDKAAAFASLSVESHHVVEKVLFNKLGMHEKCGPPFTVEKAVCVALNSEFHRRFMALRVEDRQEYNKENTKGRYCDDIISDLHTLYEGIYSDPSLAELKTLAGIINGAALWAMHDCKLFGAK
jgi:hypothetical protein